MLGAGDTVGNKTDTTLPLWNKNLVDEKDEKDSSYRVVCAVIGEAWGAVGAPGMAQWK